MDLSKLTALEQFELFRKQRLEHTHHSSAMEGTTLTFAETKSLLLEDISPNKPLAEQLVIKGYAKGFDYVVAESTKGKPLTIEMAKDLHYLLFDDLSRVLPQHKPRNLGTYRDNDVAIVGASKQPPNPVKSRDDINFLFQTSKIASLKDAAEFHIKFEKTHPFSDGNGRVGRLLLAYQIIQLDKILPIIMLEDKNRYIKALDEKNVDDLTNLLEERIKDSENEFLGDSKRQIGKINIRKETF